MIRLVMCQEQQVRQYAVGQGSSSGEDEPDRRSEDRGSEEGEELVEEPGEEDSEEWDYDRLIELGNVLGDVKTERWRLRSQTVISTLKRLNYGQLLVRDPLASDHCACPSEFHFYFYFFCSNGILVYLPPPARQQRVMSTKSRKLKDIRRLKHTAQSAWIVMRWSRCCASCAVVITFTKAVVRNGCRCEI
jgi:hypothetical protein